MYDEFRRLEIFVVYRRHRCKGEERERVVYIHNNFLYYYIGT